MQTIVNEFKASTLTIGWRAQEISETLLVHISNKRVYRDLEFEEDQQEHRTAVQQKLMSLHQDVVAIMTNSYEVFKNDGPEVGGPGVKALGLGEAPGAIRTFSRFFPPTFGGCFSDARLYFWVHPAFILADLLPLGLRILPFSLARFLPLLLVPIPQDLPHLP